MPFDRRKQRPELEREREDAAGLVGEILRLPAGRQLTVVRSRRRCHTTAFVAALCEESRGLLGDDPREALRLAGLAVSAAEQLPTERYGKGLVHDCRGRAWAYLAHAQRRCGDLGACERCLRQARQLLEQGTGDPAEPAYVDYMEALLRKEQRRFEEALRLLDRALDVYSRQDRRLAGRVLVDRGVVLFEAGMPEEAIVMLACALQEVDARREPRLVLVILHNLAAYHVEVGLLEEALSFLHSSEPLYQAVAGHADQFRRRWLEANILTQQGRPDSALAVLRQARDGLVGAGLPYDAAMVSLEMALLCATHGRLDQLKGLVAQMHPIFDAIGLAPEALAALTFFRQAVEADTVTVASIQQAITMLRGKKSGEQVRAGTRPPREPSD